MTASVLPRMTVSQALPLMEPADLLLCRGHKWLSRAIQKVSGSPYSHAGIVGFSRQDAGTRQHPMLLHVVERKGGTAVLLAREVEHYSGCYDLYQANAGNRWPNFDRQAAEQEFWSLQGIDYGKWTLLRASLRHLPFLRLFYNYDINDLENGELDKRTPFCSMAVRIACRAGGVDPVRRQRTSLTPPGQLATSLFYEPICTLVG